MTRVRDASGYRLRAACVAFNGVGSHVLLVSAAKRVGAWVLPAGGVEPGETPAESALRELWEEAGARAVAAGSPLLILHDHKKRSRTTFFAACIVDDAALDGEYPEQAMRTREWVPLADAPAALAESPAARAALLALWAVLLSGGSGGPGGNDEILPFSLESETPQMPPQTLVPDSVKLLAALAAPPRSAPFEVHFALHCKDKEMKGDNNKC